MKCTQRINMDLETGDISLEDIIHRFKEYGQIYKTIKSDVIKEQLLHSAPPEVLEAFAIVTKNILIGHIKVTRQEFKQLKQYK